MIKKDTIKHMAEQWLPPIVISSLRRHLARLRFHRYSDPKILLQNKQLQDSGKGKRAFLLATGPSIKDENLKVLQGEDCFSISNFFLHEDIKVISPKIHFFAPYHKPLILENYIQWLQLADQTLPETTQICLEHDTKELVDQYKIFPKRKIWYLYFTQYPSSCAIDITKPILSPQTGPLMILPTLLYMRYEKIYLLGCDHNTLRFYKHTIKHFYNRKLDIRKNAADNLAWANIIAEHQTSLNVFMQYQAYMQLMKKNDLNSQIINLSNDSWLDIFPYSRLKQLFPYD